MVHVSLKPAGKIEAISTRTCAVTVKNSCGRREGGTMVAGFTVRPKDNRRQRRKVEIQGGGCVTRRAKRPPVELERTSHEDHPRRRRVVHGARGRHCDFRFFHHHWAAARIGFCRQTQCGWSGLCGVWPSDQGCGGGSRHSEKSGDGAKPCTACFNCTNQPEEITRLLRAVPE